MNKKELISAVAAKAGKNNAVTKDVINALLEVVTEELSGKRTITLTGFGAFSTKYRAGRTGRNPATGAAMEIEGRYSPHFKPGSSLKEAVQ